jgi:hypothetical protein
MLGLTGTACSTVIGFFWWLLAGRIESVEKDILELRDRHELLTKETSATKEILARQPTKDDLKDLKVDILAQVHQGFELLRTILGKR